MRSILPVVLVACLVSAAWGADENENNAQNRVRAAATILQAIQSAPDQGIPEKVLASAACVAIVPSMLNGGFVLGMRYGRGVATCRTPKAGARRHSSLSREAATACNSAEKPWI